MKKYRMIIFVCCVLAVMAAGGKLMENRERQEQTGKLMENREKQEQAGKLMENRERQEQAGKLRGDCSRQEKDGKLTEDRGGRLWIPTVQDVSENPYIYRYNHELGRAKGLLEENCLNYRYLCLQAVYRANLDAYLMETLDIRSLDEELKNSGFGFVSHKPEDQNLYERESAMGLEFIYLRNNLYIEYLSREQLSLLEHSLGQGEPYVTDAVKDMAKETYQEIIRVRDPGDWEGESRFLYPESQGRKPVIPNHALVLGIANDMEYDAAGRLVPDENRTAKYEYLDRIKEDKEREYLEILGTEVYILTE